MNKDALTKKRVIKLEELLESYDLDFSDLKKLKQGSWDHLDEESING